MKKIIAIFVVASIAGFIGESIFVFISAGYFKDSGNMGLYYQLYGFCAIGMYLIFKNFKFNFLTILLILTLATGIIEFYSNYVVTELLNIPTWDYTDEVLDVFGRTSLPRSLGIAFVATLFYKFVIPKIFLFLEDKFFTYTCYVLFGVIMIDSVRQLLMFL